MCAFISQVQLVTMAENVSLGDWENTIVICTFVFLLQGQHVRAADSPLLNLAALLKTQQ